jgi:hypothetical protein
MPNALVHSMFLFIFLSFSPLTSDQRLFLFEKFVNVGYLTQLQLLFTWQFGEIANTVVHQNLCTAVILIYDVSQIPNCTCYF